MNSCWSVESAVFSVYVASWLRREVAFWFVGLMMDESSFFFVQQANDLRRQRHQSFSVLLDGCLVAEFYSFLTIFHLALLKHGLCALRNFQ